MRRARLAAAAAVLALHGAALLLLLMPASPRQRELPRSLRLQLLPPAPPPPDAAARPLPARAAAARVALQPPRSTPAALVAELPAVAASAGKAASAAPAASAAAALDLRLPLQGPRRAGAADGSLAKLAAQLRVDPRANSPRLGLEERMAVALGTPCFVDEMNAEGQVQRFPGRWVRAPSHSDAVWQGVTGNLGVGGKAPPVTVAVCKRQ